MTEQGAIERIRYRIETASNIAGRGVDGKAFEDLEMAIDALEELQQYRALGTVKEIKKKIRKELPYMSIAQKKFKSELNSYRALGTVEELREARGKQVPKKAEYKILKSLPMCPNCGEVNLVQDNEYGNVICKNKFCPDCGQAIDWSDTE